MNLKTIAILACAGTLALLTSCTSTSGVAGPSGTSMAYARVGEVDSGFVMPLAPSRSAMPSSKLPSLGCDKHNMPFYHPAQRTRVVRTTAYTHSESDHVGYGPRNALGTSLKYSTQVRSAAADWSVYPVGTTFRVKGQPYLYVVDDYGSALVGTATIDIYQPNKDLMRSWGRRYIEITIVRWGDPNACMEVLASRAGYPHCSEMLASLRHRMQFGYYAKAE